MIGQIAAAAVHLMAVLQLLSTYIASSTLLVGLSIAQLDVGRRVFGASSSRYLVVRWCDLLAEKTAVTTIHGISSKHTS